MGHLHSTDCSTLVHSACNSDHKWVTVIQFRWRSDLMHERKKAYYFQITSDSFSYFSFSLFESSLFFPLCSLSVLRLCKLNEWSSRYLGRPSYRHLCLGSCRIYQNNPSKQEFKRIREEYYYLNLLTWHSNPLLLITIKMIQPSNVQCLLSEMTQTECGCEKTDKRQTVGNRRLASFCQMLSVSDW